MLSRYCFIPVIPSSVPTLRFTPYTNETGADRQAGEKDFPAAEAAARAEAVRAVIMAFDMV
jgi:hypothetical protein